MKKKQSVLEVLGDVRVVLSGCVNEMNLEKCRETIEFGLGAGSFSGCCGLGEGIVLNHVFYTCHVNPKTGELETNRDTKEFKTPFLMGITTEQKPSKILSIDFPKGLPLKDLFEHLGEEELGYAFVGEILFENLSSSYLKIPPIYKEPINENSDKYWAAKESHPNCHTYVFGVVITKMGRQHFSLQKLEKAFYVNPLEVNQGDLLSHTHAALLSQPSQLTEKGNHVHFYEAFDPNCVKGVRHIFTDSLIKEGQLAIFSLQEIKS